MTFAKDQVKAASAFAHTMIVVDDEPLASNEDEGPKGEVATPTRKSKSGSTTKSGKVVEAKISHPLNAKSLVKTALEVGLVCSVVNPDGSETEIASNLAKVAKRADIVSLDWHMNRGDDGELATEIIQSILRSDGDVGGRLRLIAIYTGNPAKGEIFDKLTTRLNAKLDAGIHLEERNGALVNSHGLRIVWREKALGSKPTGAKISEAELPLALLKEFSKLSEGLLTNVALGTISALRDSTHHVLSKFNPTLDGPFFHHRAFLEEPKESVEYAISVVLSALKSEVDRSKVSSDFIAPAAIERRIRALNQSPKEHKFRYADKNGTEQTVELHSREVSRIVTHGYTSLVSPEDRKKLSIAVHDRMALLPGKQIIKNNFSNVFFDDSQSAKAAMLDFSVLTNAKVHELSTRHQRVKPRLDLGSVLFSKAQGYLLCLQATCDTVRGHGAFFFVPLELSEKNHDHVVPHCSDVGVKRLVCLTVPANCYTRSVILNFGKINPSTGGVPIRFEKEKQQYYVKDENRKKFRWLANLKYKRALRTAQKVSQEITRIGFDEFEPFRKS